MWERIEAGLHARFRQHPKVREALPAIEHALTHFDWTLQPLRWQLPSRLPARRLAALTQQLPPGRWVSLDQALQMGLVNAVVPAAELDAEVQRWCDEILALSPTAIAIAKRSFNADSDSIRGIGGLGMQALSLFYGTAESHEGVAAFLEKRPARFRQLPKDKKPSV